jgi:ribosomal protein S18 acetylase RimI-like enzyme
MTSTPNTNLSDNKNLSYRHAEPADAVMIAALVNSGYRGDSSRQGWTTEANLLEGARINPDGVHQLILADDTVILLCSRGQDPIGCVLLQKTDDGAYLGMFVVSPLEQGNGIGKEFMLTAEALVQKLWGVHKMWMTVITLRTELIAFYERRGYVRTGRFTPFPVDAEDHIFLVNNLQFEELEKILD